MAQDMRDELAEERATNEGTWWILIGVLLSGSALIGYGTSSMSVGIGVALVAFSLMGWVTREGLRIRL